MKLRLKRELGLFEATMYGIGIIVGAGIYVLIGVAAGITGNSLWLSFVIGAIISAFTGLSYAELSSMFPKAAAEYVYVHRAYKNEFFAFLLGWLIIFTGIVAVATISLGFGGYVSSLTNFSITLSAIGLIIVLSFINFLGIKESSKLFILLTAVEVFGLILIISLGFGKIGSVNYFETPFGLSGIFAAAALIFFAYIGFEDVVNIAEETKNPRRIIPKALILAVIVTTILYVLTSVVAVSLVNWKELGESKAPLALAASKSFLGENASLIISIIALAATISTVLGVLIVVSRMMYGMSDEGAFPKIFSKLHVRRRTPMFAIIAIMIFSIIFVFFGKIRSIAEITSLGAFITFTNINLSLIWLRYTKPDMYRPFKVPLNIGRYPIIAFLGVFANLFMIFQFEMNLLLLGLGVIVLGAVAYVLYKKGIIG